MNLVYSSLHNCLQQLLDWVVLIPVLPKFEQYNSEWFFKFWKPFSAQLCFCVWFVLFSFFFQIQPPSFSVTQELKRHSEGTERFGCHVTGARGHVYISLQQYGTKHVGQEGNATPPVLILSLIITNKSTKQVWVRGLYRILYQTCLLFLHPVKFSQTVNLTLYVFCDLQLSLAILLYFHWFSWNLGCYLWLNGMKTAETHFILSFAVRI